MRRAFRSRMEFHRRAANGGHLRLVRRGRWMPFVADRVLMKPVFLVGDDTGTVVTGFTLDPDEAWYLDGIPSDDQACRLVNALNRSFVGWEVFALGDKEREEVYEFRGYGFRLWEGGTGDSHE